MKSNTGWWIVGIIALLIFAGPQLMSALGWIIGALFSIGIMGIVALAMAAVVFFVVTAVGGSIFLAVAVTVGALALALLSSMWPLLIICGIAYLIFRKRPETV